MHSTSNPEDLEKANSYLFQMTRNKTGFLQTIENALKNKAKA